ncbi:hypothetical protein [Winogradskyella sp. PG-2]|uniref:hypothetical protein n=1 Tax=Winogradskyella sp. PG-2 TaxID=754409 RepID=UPI000458756C|nr:hypothetical protein [Winogradskyella sp. PG-2]BAO75049.1 hypothetical protein WPG_0819 [Winogradskyella sp. PG-2]
MKELIKKIIIISQPINKLYVFVLRILNKTSEEESRRRGQLSIFDYQAVIQDMPLYPTDMVIDNNFYGLSRALQKYMKTTLPLNSYIEHGLVLGTLVKEDAVRWCTPKIMTLSSKREAYIKKATVKPVFKIGPYIHYAEDLLSDDELRTLKKELGKVLMVFPSHSIKNIEAAFNNDELIAYIESKKEDFDSVVICLYWRDAHNKVLVESYVDIGYKIMSAGHVHDTNFLSRLKSIIKLSDFTISNSVGTHIGYITFLGKPQVIIGQTIDYNVSKNDNRAFDQRNKAATETLKSETEEILNAYSSYDFHITEQQLKIADKYWGISQIKKPEEIKQFIKK